MFGKPWSTKYVDHDCCYLIYKVDLSRVDYLITRELEQMRDDSAALRRLAPNIPTLKINSDLGTTFDYLYLIPTD